MSELVSHNHLSLKERVSIPASKSQTMRALIFAFLASGESHIHNALASPDTNAMLKAIASLGANITHNNDGSQSIRINGTAGRIHSTEQIIDCGNSGQVLRFIAALATLQNQPITLDGDHSIRHNRPMHDVITGITQLGGHAKSLMQYNYAPLITAGPVRAGTVRLKGDHAQPVSAMLMLMSQLEGQSKIIVEQPNETPWIDLTLDWLDRLGANIKHYDHTHYYIRGKINVKAFDYTVPGDFSSAAFPAIAALLKQGNITLEGLQPNDPQGDKQLFNVLETLGANICWQNNDLIVAPSPSMTGGTINVNNFIDAVPILCVLGCHLPNGLILTGASAARKKESNRLNVMMQELNKLGANITETHDGLIILPSQLHGGRVESHNDHRVAMALFIAGLISDERVIVNNTDCIQKSFAEFTSLFIE